MKIRNLCTLVSVIGLTSCAVHAHVDVGVQDEDRVAIEKLREQFREGVRQGNPDMIVAVLDENAVNMGPGTPAVEGKEVIAEWVRAAFNKPRPDASYEIDDFELADDWAFERGTYSRGRGKRIWIYRRQEDGSWRIKYIMWNSNSK